MFALILLPALALAASPVTPIYGPGHLTSDWIGIGDSRTDCNVPQYPLNLDMPTELCGKFVSKSGSSLFVTMHFDYSSQFTPYDGYKGCGREKVFYEGVNFSPNKNYGCLSDDKHTWVENKVKFYSKFYQMASQAECFAVVNLTRLNMQVNNCSANRPTPVNPQVYKITGPSSAYFYLPSSARGYDCDEHLVPLCYYSGGRIASDNKFYDNYVAYYDQYGTSYAVYENYTINDSKLRKYSLQCDYISLPPGNYTASAGSFYLFYPTRTFCFKRMNYTVPVQAIQSIWSAHLESDNAIDQACQSPYCIYYAKKTPYTVTNGSNQDHGDDEVREMMKGLLYNSSCVSPQGHTPLALYSTEMIYTPNYGSCPQFVRLFDGSGTESPDVTSSVYFVATWVLVVVLILLVFILVSFCVSS